MQRVKNLPTASSLHRALVCPASEALPRAPWTPPTPEMLRGSAVHRYLEIAVLAGQPAGLAALEAFCHKNPGTDLAALRPLCAAIDLGAITQGREIEGVEVAYGLDVQTGVARELGRQIERGYPKRGEYEISGTADLVLRGEGGAPWVVADYKTTFYDTSASASWFAQLSFLALAAARLHGLDEIEIGVCRISEDGEIRWEVQRLDALDLDALLHDLRLGAARIREAQRQHAAGDPLTPHPGDHCRYCPSYQYCSAHQSLARQVATGELSSSLSAAALTPETAGRALERLGQLEQLLDHARRQVREWIQSHGYAVLPDGRRMGYVEREREEIVGEVAEAVIRERAGDEAVEAAVDRKVTKAGLKRALGAAASEVLEEIGRRGGVKRVSYTQLREIKTGGGR